MAVFGDEPGELSEPGSGDIGRVLAAAADLCLPPWRHAVVNADCEKDDGEEINVRLEARSPEGIREPHRDLDLEIYPSGGDLHVMVSWCQPPDRPMLWHGRHPVWMDGTSGERCDRPEDGAPLEAMCRRIRALLISGIP